MDPNNLNPPQQAQSPTPQTVEQLQQPQVVDTSSPIKTPLASQPVQSDFQSQQSTQAPIDTSVSTAASNVATINSPVQPLYGAPNTMQNVVSSNFDQLQKPRKSKKIIFIVIGLVIVLGLGVLFAIRLIAVNKASSYTINVSGSQQYTDPLGFKITPPQGWHKVVNCQSSIACFIAPTPSVSGDGSFSDIIAITGVKLASKRAQSLTLQQFVNAGLDAESKVESKFQVLSSAPETLQGVPATLVTVSYDSNNNRSLTVASLYVISHGNAYTINGLGLTADWPQSSSDIQKSLLSFVP